MPFVVSDLHFPIVTKQSVADEKWWLDQGLNPGSFSD